MSYSGGESIPLIPSLSAEPVPLQVSQSLLQRSPLRISPSVASAYGPILAQEYSTGVQSFDKHVHTSLKQHTAESVQHITTHALDLLQVAEPLKNQSRPMPNLLSSILSPMGVDYQELLSRTHDLSNTGIEQVNLQAFTHGIELTLYYPQNSTPAHGNVRQVLGNMSKARDPENASPISEQLYEYLAERQGIDKSQRKLDRRLRVAECTAQLAIIQLLAQDFRETSELNAKWQKIAASSFQTLLRMPGKPQTLQNRLAVLLNIGEQWGEYGQSEEHPDTKQIIGNVAMHTAIITRSVVARMNYFATIYDALGYKPPFPELVKRPATGQTRPASTITEEVQETKRQQQELAQKVAAERELQEALANAAIYRPAIEAFNKLWSISNKAYKTGDYSAMRNVLTGEHDSFPMRPETTFAKTDARHIIGFLAQVQSKLDDTSLEQVHFALEASRREESTLARYAQNINSILRSHNASLEPLEQPRKLNLYTQVFAKNWQAFRPIIQELWPQNGIDLAANLQALFTLTHPEFAQANVPEAHHEPLMSERPASARKKADAQAKKDLEELTAQAEELDIVVFPDKPTDKQIAHVLREHGIKASSLSPERLERVRDFSTLRDVLDDCEFYISKAGVKSSRRRYLILRFTIEGQRYALAESLELGRSTYALAERLTEEGTTLIDLLKSYKSEARNLGAREIQHDPNTTPHHEKILNMLMAMHEEANEQGIGH